MQVKHKTHTASCRNPVCQTKMRRKDFKARTIGGAKILQCKNCGYYNSPEIFSTWREVKNTQLTFGVDLV